MADKLALPLLLPTPPLSKPFFSLDPHPLKPQPPPSLTPILNDILQPNSTTKPISPIIPKTPRRIGKHNDPNKGKPWSSHLSPQGQLVFKTLIHPTFNSSQIDNILPTLVEFHEKDSEFGSKLLSLDVLGLIQGLGYYKKVDLALLVFDWVKKYYKDSGMVLRGSVVAVVISMLGKDGRVSVASSLFRGLRKDGFVT